MKREFSIIIEGAFDETFLQRQQSTKLLSAHWHAPEYAKYSICWNISVLKNLLLSWVSHLTVLCTHFTLTGRLSSAIFMNNFILTTFSELPFSAFHLDYFQWAVFFNISDDLHFCFVHNGYNLVVVSQFSCLLKLVLYTKVIFIRLSCCGGLGQLAYRCWSMTLHEQYCL